MGEEKVGVSGYDNVGVGGREVLEEGVGRGKLVVIGVVRMGEGRYENGVWVIFVGIGYGFGVVEVEKWRGGLCMGGEWFDKGWVGIVRGVGRGEVRVEGIWWEGE